jgi:hypothetical protein
VADLNANSGDGITVPIRADRSELTKGLDTAAAQVKSFSERVKAVAHIGGAVATGGEVAGVVGTIARNPALKAMGHVVGAVATPVHMLAGAFESVGGAVLAVGFLMGGLTRKLSLFASTAGMVIGITAKIAATAVGLGVSVAGMVIGLAAKLTATATLIGLAFAKIVGDIIGTLTSLVQAIATGVGQVISGLAGLVADLGAAIAEALNVAARAAGTILEHAVAAAGMLAKTLAAVGVAAGSAAFALYKMVMVASNLNETINKTGEVFKDSTGIVVKAADEMNRAFGVPRGTFLDAASSLGLVVKASGYTEAAAASLSVQLAKLAVDASSFYNVPLEEAMIAMRAGLVGEAEPLRRFGVLLDEAAVKAQGAKMGFKAVHGELTLGQKVQARSALIIAGMATASGDLARTSDALANRLRELQGRVLNLAERIGSMFLPAFKVIAAGLSLLTRDFTDFVERNRGSIEAFAAYLETAGVVIGNLFAKWPDVLNLVKAAFDDLKRNGKVAFDVLAESLGAVVKTLMPLLAAFGGFVVAWGVKLGGDLLQALANNFAAIMVAVKSLMSQMMAAFNVATFWAKPIFLAFAEWLGAWALHAGVMVGTKFLAGFAQMLKPGLGAIEQLLGKDVADKIANWLAPAPDNLNMDMMQNAAQAIAQNVKDAMAQIAGIQLPGIGGIPGAGDPKKAAEDLAAAMKKLNDAMTAMVDNIMGIPAKLPGVGNDVAEAAHQLQIKQAEGAAAAANKQTAVEQVNARAMERATRDEARMGNKRREKILGDQREWTQQQMLAAAGLGPAPRGKIPRTPMQQAHADALGVGDEAKAQRILDRQDKNHERNQTAQQRREQAAQERWLDQFMGTAAFRKEFKGADAERRAEMVREAQDMSGLTDAQLAARHGKSAGGGRPDFHSEWQSAPDLARGLQTNALSWGKDYAKQTADNTMSYAQMFAEWKAGGFQVKAKGGGPAIAGQPA